MDEAEYIAAIEKAHADIRLCEARCRAEGKKFQAYDSPKPKWVRPEIMERDQETGKMKAVGYGDGYFEPVDIIQQLEAMESHLADLRQLLATQSGRAIDDSSSSSAVVGIPNSPATPPVASSSNPQTPLKLNATERCKLAIAQSKKPEVIAAAQAEKKQRVAEYFANLRPQAGATTEKPMTATEKILAAEGVKSLEELAQKRRKDREKK